MKVLITAGGVYGKLDANKLVGNRIRGIWAARFARHLVDRGHEVTLSVPDVPAFPVTTFCGRPKNLTVIEHHGFNDYHIQCVAQAPHHDAVVLAAAVVNWIPKTPFFCKMPTKGYNVGDVLHIPFVLAPRVIEDMKAVNPKMTLIGCKMLVDAKEDALIDAAYEVLLKSRCNAVIANDMGKGLKRKIIVNKDRSVQEFDNDFDGFYDALTNLIEDEHFHTEYTKMVGPVPGMPVVEKRFNQLVDQHRSRFTPVESDRVIPVKGGRVFGSLVLTIPHQGWLTSPREKGGMFTAEDAALVLRIDEEQRSVTVQEGCPKATLNAPLLIRYTQSFQLTGALHFHDQVGGLPTLPYAQPGTLRDSLRDFSDAHREGFNIEGHGCVLPVRD